MKRHAGAGSILLMAMACASAMDAPYPTGPVEKLFPDPPRPVEKTYSIDDRTIHYREMAGGPARIVFLHGTPGDWQAWAMYLADPELRKRATLISVDRPGFGLSDPGRVAPALAAQARLLEPLLRRQPGEGPGEAAVVVGHSLGGPIAAQLAMDFPAEVRAVIAVAPSIDPSTEQPRWYNRLMTWKLVQWITPDVFIRSNRELMPLVAELKLQTPRWKDLRMPVTVIQGAKDELVDPKTAAYAERILPKPNGRVVVVPDQGHFVLWKRPDLITREIVDVLDRTAAASPAAAPPAAPSP